MLGVCVSRACATRRHAAPSFSPAKPSYESDGDDSNPFNAAPAAPTHEAVAGGQSSGDPQNPFKAGRSQETSEDGRGRPQAIAA